MARLLGLDYGRKRCGVAVTDILQLSINPITTVNTDQLITFCKKYLAEEDVEKLLIGWPTHSDGRETYLVKEIKSFLITFAKLFPDIEIIKVDESFTSFEAKQIIFQSGTKKKKRRDKSLIDKVSAVIIIKRYLEAI